MTISQRERAQKDLALVISGELSPLLLSVEWTKGHPLTRNAVSVLSRTLASRMMASERLLETMVKLVPKKQDEWLTTEEAARKSGYSRPFIAALLDNPGFGGRVTKTEKGHRRVHSGDFENWMTKHRKQTNFPTDVKNNRSGPRDVDPSPLRETTRQRSKRTNARDEAINLAKKMGLG